jgi:hypothetical protein
MKKNYFLLAVWVLLTLPSLAQNVAINADGSLPNSNAILDIKSGNKGILIPRLDSSSRKAIPGTKGLLVYDTTTSSFWYNTGTHWLDIATGSALPIGDSAWLLTGNGNARDTIDFLGTTNNIPLNIRVNNQPSGRIDATKSNAFWGYLAGLANNTGNYNTGIGTFSLQRNTTGNRNTAIGTWAMIYNIAGYNNTAVGAYSMFENLTGYYNTALGEESLNFNTTGIDNTATGVDALHSSTTGSANTAVGFQSLYNSGGSDNTSIGTNSLMTLTAGSNNTAVGYGANVSTGSLFNATAIGNGAVVNASNKVRIGNSAVTVIEGQVPFTTPSDGRYKFNVREDVKGLDFILQLRPITYQFDVQRFDAQLNHQATQQGQPANYAMQTAYDEATRIRRSGFIAQEVEQAANATGYDFSGIIKPKTDQDHYSLSYDAFVVPLVKAVQEQQQIIDILNKKMTAQQQDNDTENKKIADLQRQLDEIKKLLQPATSHD